MNTSPLLRFHHWLPTSQVNGPGIRFTLWVQGCSFHCPGCFNPATHDPSGGSDISIPDLVDKIVLYSSQINGLTLSGGEPFEQPGAVARLLSSIRKNTTLNTLVFTGFTWQQVQLLPIWPEIKPNIDALIAGPYQQQNRLAQGLLGSKNKTLHLLSPAFQPADFIDIPSAEIFIDPRGGVTISGIDPLDMIQP